LQYYDSNKLEILSFGEEMGILWNGEGQRVVHGNGEKNESLVQFF
jgi:hypothetical protein